MLSLQAEVRLTDASLLPHLLKNLPHLHVMTAKRLSHCLQQPVLWSYSYWKVFIGSQRCWQSGTAGGLQGKFLRGHFLEGVSAAACIIHPYHSRWHPCGCFYHPVIVCASLCQSVPPFPLFSTLKQAVTGLQYYILV